MEIYIVGIPEAGGCWFGGSYTVYQDWSDADKALKKDREGGVKYTRIFTITPKASSKATNTD
tara:strand:+ start:367 stop:552 length:186 start_codon:yes stop_codon:yes gene_type:complete